MGVADYLAGRRVYNGYSSSPHMGTNLDPTGYIQREKDGERRSGLAQAAMQKLQGIPTGGQNYGSAITSAYPTAVTAPTSNTTADKVATPAPTPAKKTTRTATGKVKKKKPGVEILPLDPDIAQMRIALMRQRAQAYADFARTGRNIKQDYGIAKRDQTQAHPLEVAQLLGSFAGRGMGESGGEVVGRTKSEADYQERLADLLRTRTRSLSDLSAAKNTYTNSYQNQLERLLVQQAQNAAAKAGSLNLSAWLKKYNAKYNPKPKKKK